ncbi:hypothetical protein [Actinoplanes sp. NPDC051411]|uniref:hypothetical protein n=1 Tax=Actinoplanes sp. NPDC051411 TaxID=3155522 RepID=UPI00341716EB
MFPDLHALSIGERAAFQPRAYVTINGHVHQLGTIIRYTDAETGELTEINAYSITTSAWLNLITGRPVGDPRDEEDVDLMARYYDARGLAADLDAGRRLAQHRRRNDPSSYTIAVDHVRRTLTADDN